MSGHVEPSTDEADDRGFFVCMYGYSLITDRSSLIIDLLAQLVNVPKACNYNIVLSLSACATNAIQCVEDLMAIYTEFHVVTRLHI